MSRRKSVSYYKHLPNRVGGKIRGRGRVVRIRTIVPKKGRAIHIRVVSKAGPRGGHTVAGGVIRTKRRRRRHK